MLSTGSSRIDAERAFAREIRARRRAAVARRLRLGRTRADALPVYATAAAASAGLPHVAEIPLDAIAGTLEPSRARQFDRCFRPRAAAQERWERIWMAEDRGVVLPPISVVPVRGGFAVRDGHHRVSVARARGAAAIDAILDHGAAA
jgi:hypothetical protein